MKIAWYVLVLAVSLHGAPATDISAAPSPADPKSDRRPGAWIAAVRAHQPGRADDALLTVAAWTKAEIERVLPHVAEEPDAAQLLTRGLVLHADIGILEHAGGIRGGMRVMQLLDGRASGDRRVSLQWAIGRRIAATLVGLDVKARPGHEPRTTDGPERDRRERVRVARLWYHATAAMLQEEGHLGFVHTHANAGLSLLGDDAVLLMYRGTARQAYADPRLQMYARPRALVGTSTVELDQAGRDLRSALELDPQLVEARIRLAHVLGDKGRHEEAAALLRAAMAVTLPPFLEYYGALVLGRVEERLGRLPEARAAYERAGRRFPDAQVPRVALSRLALLDGRPTDGLDLLRQQPAGAAGGEPPQDPWWWYFRSHEPDARARIEAMRELVR